MSFLSDIYRRQADDHLGSRPDTDICQLGYHRQDKTRVGHAHYRVLIKQQQGQWPRLSNHAAVTRL